jgi:aldose 1-epimerase
MFTIESGDARLTVAPEEGGRIVEFSVDGFQLLVPREVNAHDFGCFPMAPWAGRIRHGRFTFGGEEYQLLRNKPPHAIHGTARDQRWEVVGDGVIATELGEPWPFGGRVVQRFVLAPHQLELTMEVHAGEQPMPASCGWHPWWNRFPRDDTGLHLELRAGAMLEKDDEGIQTGELVDVRRPPWDDCFTALGAPPVTLRWPGAVTISLGTSCQYVVVYDEPQHAICAEPQTAPPDAFNLEPTVLEPGGLLVATATWRWSRGV